MYEYALQRAERDGDFRLCGSESAQVSTSRLTPTSHRVYTCPLMSQAVGEEISASIVTVRLLTPADSLEDLTAMLHRAYAGQMAMGLSPLAGRQSVEITRQRCASGECYVAVMDARREELSSLPAPRDRDAKERIVGVILFHEIEDAEGPAWFRRRDVDYFSQFGVEPGLQGHGIGGRLLDQVERRALECGSVELGLSMAEPDVRLRQFYERRGFRFIEHWQWPYTNYRSVILSKPLVRTSS